MLDMFTEGRISGYAFALFLGVAIGFFLHRWRRQTLPAILVPIALLGLVWLADRLVETPKEGMAKAIDALREAGLAKDWNRVAMHLSESFRHKQIGSKKELEVYFKRWREALPNPRLVSWGFSQVPDSPQEVEFMFKAEGDGQIFFARVRAQMEPTPTGWKLKGFRLFNPVADLKEMDIP